MAVFSDEAIGAQSAPEPVAWKIAEMVVTAPIAASEGMR